MTLPPQPVAAPPAPADEKEEFGFFPGEVMAFDVHLAGMTAGEAQLAVGALGETDGHHTIIVKSRAATTGAAKLVKNIVDEATTTIDVDSGRPLVLDTSVTMNDKATVAHAKFTGSIADVTFSKDGDPAPHTYRVDFGKVTVHDSHSAMAQMRGWHASAGTTKTVYVVGGRRMWRVDMKFVGIETIGTPMGNRRTVHMSGAAYRAKPDLKLEQPKAAATRTFDVWVSDDADRVPVKMSAKTELGDVEMDLTEYNRP
jgi:Protein of unknown function (DUF3108)